MRTDVLGPVAPSSSRPSPARHVAAGRVAVAALALGACSSGGQIAGTADAHCAGVAAPVVGICEADADAASAADARTNYGDAADDDDCKYHLSWSLSGATVERDETIALTLTERAGGGPVSGAAPTLTATAAGGAATTLPAAVQEPSPGHYLLTPVRFTEAGRTTLRFDLFPTCSPAADASGNASPRAHAAFYLDVTD